MAFIFTLRDVTLVITVPGCVPSETFSSIGCVDEEVFSTMGCLVPEVFSTQGCVV